MDAIRTLVSGRRNRLRDGVYDLDLCYVTPRIIAMSIPGESLEAVYRNPIEEVGRYMKTKHGDEFMIFNLCTSDHKRYDYSKFNYRVVEMGWPDHYTAPLHVLLDLCAAIDAWLAGGSERVVAVHCLAGKGRTGVCIASYLVYSGFVFSNDALFKGNGGKQTSHNGAESHTHSNSLLVSNDTNDESSGHIDDKDDDETSSSSSSSSRRRDRNDLAASTSASTTAASAVIIPSVREQAFLAALKQRKSAVSPSSTTELFASSAKNIEGEAEVAVDGEEGVEDDDDDDEQDIDQEDVEKQEQEEQQTALNAIATANNEMVVSKDDEEEDEASVARDTSAGTSSSSSFTAAGDNININNNMKLLLRAFLEDCVPPVHELASRAIKYFVLKRGDGLNFAAQRRSVRYVAQLARDVILMSLVTASLEHPEGVKGIVKGLEGVHLGPLEKLVEPPLVNSNNNSNNQQSKEGEDNDDCDVSAPSTLLSSLSIEQTTTLSSSSSSSSSSSGTGIMLHHHHRIHTPRAIAVVGAAKLSTPTEIEPHKVDYSYATPSLHLLSPPLNLPTASIWTIVLHGVPRMNSTGDIRPSLQIRSQPFQDAKEETVFDTLFGCPSGPDGLQVYTGSDSVIVFRISSSIQGDVLVRLLHHQPVLVNVHGSSSGSSSGSGSGSSSGGIFSSAASSFFKSPSSSSSTTPPIPSTSLTSKTPKEGWFTKEIFRYSFNTAFLRTEGQRYGKNIHRVFRADLDMNKRKVNARRIPQGFYFDIMYELTTADNVEEAKSFLSTTTTAGVAVTSGHENKNGRSIEESASSSSSTDVEGSNTTTSSSSSTSTACVDPRANSPHFLTTQAVLASQLLGEQAGYSV